MTPYQRGTKGPKRGDCTCLGWTLERAIAGQRVVLGYCGKKKRKKAKGGKREVTYVYCRLDGKKNKGRPRVKRGREFG